MTIYSDFITAVLMLIQYATSCDRLALDAKIRWRIRPSHLTD
ncbi:hypothetical protein [Nostoc sp. KVJ3]|nr:hypothetical protein [Nostoc sp. KVJ3]